MLKMPILNSAQNKIVKASSEQLLAILCSAMFVMANFA